MPRPAADATDPLTLLRTVVRLVLAGLVALPTTLAFAFVDAREQEITECRAGEITTWADGIDRKAVAATLRFFYRHEGAPAWFDAPLVEALVSRAVDAWVPCGVPVRLEKGTQAPDGAIIVQWSDAGARGNFGLAHLGERRLSLGPKAFALLRERNPRHDARLTLQMVISHEMGHFFGLMAHSRRCVDVLSYYHDGKGNRCFSRDPSIIGNYVEYRHGLPTACDIARCRHANGMPDPAAAASQKR